MENKITGDELVQPKIITQRENSSLNNKEYVYGNTYSIGGLTIRQHFAAMAMQGLCANYLRENVTGWCIETYATESVALADALIAALNK